MQPVKFQMYVSICNVSDMSTAAILNNILNKWKIFSVNGDSNPYLTNTKSY